MSDWPLTKIIATCGPASESPEVAGRLIEAGVAVFRLNFSHGSLADHGRRLATIREAAARLRRPVAVLGDLCGPKIRVGMVPSPLELTAGGDVILARDAREARQVEGERKDDPPMVVLPTTYAAMIDEALPGHRVLINDGAVRMLAVERRDASASGPLASLGPTLRCRVTAGGKVSTGKGINLPDSEVSAPAITEADWACIHWAVEHGLDFLALSFVRRAKEVRELKEYLAGVCPVDRGSDSMGTGSQIPVVAKIEKPQAMTEIDDIIDAADAIMVARGDLGVEMDISQVPIVQKRLLERCAQWGKPCIVATQMLETMIESTMPTRAEASDIANAVFDSADALMLSAETAVGRHPALVVDTMRRIILAAEARIAGSPPRATPPSKLVESRYRTAAMAHGVFDIACDVGARLILCWSQNGGTARYLSQNNFRAPIVAYSSDERATRRMALLFGVRSVYAEPGLPGGLRGWIDRAEADVVSREWARPGEPIVVLAGEPFGQVRSTNTIIVRNIGE
jgi:pyruvate kinase